MYPSKRKLLLMAGAAATILLLLILTTDVASRGVEIQKQYPRSTSAYVAGRLIPPIKPQTTLSADSVRSDDTLTTYQEYAKGLIPENQWNCLYLLWYAESGWNPNAQNPISTAYGIAQFLDATWAGTGIEKTSNPYKQIDAGLIYIENRYGNECTAWQHFQINNYY